MEPCRYPYTLKEDSAILKYIIEGKYHTMVGGNKLWKQLEKSETCPGRTWQSLKNRFMKKIRNDLSRPEFGLTQEQRLCLMAGTNQRGNSSERASTTDIYNLEMSSDSSEGEQSDVVVLGNNASGAGDNNKDRAIKKPFRQKEFLTWNAEWSDSDTE